MVAVRTQDMAESNGFMDILKRVFGGESFIISGTDDTEAVVLPKKKYDALRKESENAKYLEKLDRAFAQSKKGKPAMSLTWDEWEEMVHE